MHLWKYSAPEVEKIEKYFSVKEWMRRSRMGCIVQKKEDIGQKLKETKGKERRREQRK